MDRLYPKPTSERPHRFVESDLHRHKCELCAGRESDPNHDPVRIANFKARWDV